ncbi:SipW-dependent-type signal peptide-containing protein [Halobaculum sp. MBLA0143]|uniref:SipW-dependent-type signal peptide-containing protein n=1 Tax=Halobaculum sp. MBLA0143 TaxID=3079933 RepID=UPI0035261DC3
MTRERYELSRRQALAALGTVGVASAGAGLGTSAYFSDREEFTGNQLAAGELDMKVSYEEHYSDWSEDEMEGISEEDVTMEMPADTGNFTGLLGDEVGPIWVSDENVSTFQNNTEVVNSSAGKPLTLDPELACADGNRANDDPAASIALDDVKPGDFGELTLDFTLCGNPGYVWLYGALTSASENGVTEPEADDPDEEEGVVELLDEIQVIVWDDTDQDNVLDEEESTLVGPVSLRTFLAEYTLEPTNGSFGLPLPGDITATSAGGSGRNCYSAAPATHAVGFGWYLPVDHANEIQTDSVTFDLGFYTEQCRHNDGSGQNRTDVPQP